LTLAETNVYNFCVLRGLVVMDSRIIRILVLQLGLTLLISLGLFQFNGLLSATSSAAGGMISFLASLAYAVRAQMGAADAQSRLRANFAAERMKFLVNGVGFAAAFMLLKELRMPEFFLTYIATLLVYFAALAFDR
jgi:F0F1-type ATP synthase assembly protein I